MWSACSHGCQVFLHRTWVHTCLKVFASLLTAWLHCILVPSSWHDTYAVAVGLFLAGLHSSLSGSAKRYAPEALLFVVRLLQSALPAGKLAL